jgi:hypothetical protein
LNLHRTRGRRTRRGLVLAALLVLAVGCSKGTPSGPADTSPSARPSSPAKLEVESPTNGQVVAGPDVRVRVKLSGARIVPATTKNITPTTGHIHVYLDNQLVTMNFSLTGDIPDVSSGMHVLRVEFVASDHAPFDPRVFTAVTFEVKG